MAACLFNLATLGVCAQTHEKDSLRVISQAKIKSFFDESGFF